MPHFDQSHFTLTNITLFFLRFIVEFMVLLVGIREEIKAIEEGRMDKKDNPLKVLYLIK